MVIAKNDRSHTELARQFKEREVTKHYEVLVWGVVQSGRRIDLPVGRDPIERKKISTRSHRARTALTRINRAEQLHGASFLEVSIETGRTHQIRVHLSAIKHPVVGDALYGGVRRRIRSQRAGDSLAASSRPVARMRTSRDSTSCRRIADCGELAHCSCELSPATANGLGTTVGWRTGLTAAGRQQPRLCTAVPPAHAMLHLIPPADTG